MAYSTADDPKWLKMARSYLGLSEIKGPKHSSKIVALWTAMKAPFRDDETPWCGAFVGGTLVAAGYAAHPAGASARAWLNYGKAIPMPAVGAIVVFWRGSPKGWSGHVGYVVGRDQNGNLMVLGGNQSDAVNIKPFGKDRVLGYRWADKNTSPLNYNLPIYKSNGQLSTNEA